MWYGGFDFSCFSRNNFVAQQWTHLKALEFTEQRRVSQYHSFLQVQIPRHCPRSPKARIKITMLPSTGEGLSEVSSSDAALSPLKAMVAFKDSTSSQGFPELQPPNGRTGLCVTCQATSEQPVPRECQHHGFSIVLHVTKILVTVLNRAKSSTNF